MANERERALQDRQPNQLVSSSSNESVRRKRTVTAGISQNASSIKKDSATKKIRAQCYTPERIRKPTTTRR